MLGCISHLKVGTLRTVTNSTLQSSGVLSIILAIPLQERLHQNGKSVKKG